MKAPAIDIADMLLAESSLSLELGTSLFVGQEPPRPDNTVTVFDVSGSPGMLTMDKQKYEYPMVHIRIRNRDYEIGWNLANEIYLSLHGRAHETWNDSIYEVIKVSSGPAHFDWDDNNRARFIINFNLQRR